MRMTACFTYLSNIQTVLNNLKKALENIFQWFSSNYLVASAGKCHLTTSSKTTVNIHIANAAVSYKKKLNYWK